jgi:hypothetical protein
VVAWLPGELTFLAPYKGGLFRYGLVIGGSVLLLFLHLCALYYGIACCLFLRDAGRKLTHIDRQLGTAEVCTRICGRTSRPSGGDPMSDGPDPRSFSFWNKTARNIACMTQRAPGWNLGTMREFGGAALDLKNLARGEVSDRLLYVPV